MARSTRGEPPPPSDPDAGAWQGRPIARRLTSEDGYVILVGKSAADNDLLSLKLASPDDFWFHVAGEPGSHVVVRNPDNVERLPRATAQLAAGLAAGYSKARRGGRVAVHQSRCREVYKRRGQPPGEVMLGRHTTVHATPIRLDDDP